MTATIYSFPKKQSEPEKVEYRIPLFSDEEIELTLVAVNVFNLSDIKYNMKTLCTVDPELVLNCLIQATETDVFSDSVKSKLRYILNNVEKV
jgi:hypothetical protein